MDTYSLRVIAETASFLEETDMLRSPRCEAFRPQGARSAGKQGP